MTEEVRLEWQYTPPDYFEEPHSFEHDGTQIEIADGCITARLRASPYVREQGSRDEIEEELANRFLGAQLINYKPYKISGPREVRTNPDGSQHVTVHLKAMSLIVTAGHLDSQKIDADGNIIKDTRAERIERRLGLSERVAKHAPHDVTLHGMLQSHRRAVSDPDNELISLYEIRDALQKRFAGEKSARQATGGSLNNWKRLGYLANTAPVRQGRHRGQHSGDELRDATEEELSQARAIALNMIEGYLNYLEGQGQTGSDPGEPTCP